MDIKTTAFGFTKFGGPEVFEEREITLSLNEKQNVLIKIERVGINPANALVREGKFSASPVVDGFQVIGGEIQGEIVNLHAPVEGLKVGDKVIVKSRNGSYAKMIATSHKNVYKIPSNMPLDFAAGFPAAGTTAYWALYGEFIPIQKGDTLAIMGASGGVGSLLLQLAKPLGVKTIGVASAKNENYVMDLGADAFLDYADERQIKEYEKKANSAIDASLFSAGQALAIRLLQPGGTYLGLTNLPEGKEDISAVQLTITPAMKSKKAMEHLFDFYEKYGLELHISYILPLSLKGVVKAHELISAKRNSGKIILSEAVKD